jgi:hypothetical protein
VRLKEAELMDAHGFVTVLSSWGSLVAAFVLGMRLGRGRLAVHWMSRRPMIPSGPRHR